jgi:hypothetical protein
MKAFTVAAGSKRALIFQQGQKLNFLNLPTGKLQFNEY